jgi:serine/threonine protein kinase
MVSCTGNCDRQRLERLLAGGLTADSEADAEAHLQVCPACQRGLDNLAGGAGWWSRIKSYLDDDDSQTAPFDAAAPPWTSVNLEFLRSSDRPGSFGRIGPYEVLELLGRGGAGVVLKAFDAALHRLVAIKVLTAGNAASEAARKRFAREARAAAAVVHDHVVAVHAVDADATPPYLVMAFVTGQSLQQRLDASGPLELKEVLRIGMQTAAGLGAAHAQGLVHRDIKPANIMLENGVERVKITDFGLARAVDDASITQNGMVAGTPHYMAPEQARGEAVDQRADLFALGSTLYAISTGRVPFQGESALAVIRRVGEAEPAAIGSLNPAIPVWFEGIVSKLHAKDPARRFQSAADLADLLERCLAHVQQPARNALPREAKSLGRMVRRREHFRKRILRWRTLAFLVVCLLVAGLARFVPFSRTGAALSDKEEQQAVENSKAESKWPANFDNDFAEKTKTIRIRSEQVQDALAGGTSETIQVEPTAGAIRQRADKLRQSLASDETPGFDIEAEVKQLKRRLQALGQSLGHDPQSTGLIRETGN